MANKCLILFEQRIMIPIIHQYSLVVVFYPESEEYEFLKNRYDFRNHGRIAANLFEKLIREYGIVSIEMVE